jgi:hypothetical protein
VGTNASGARGLNFADPTNNKLQHNADERSVHGERPSE